MQRLLRESKEIREPGSALGPSNRPPKRQADEAVPQDESALPDGSIEPSHEPILEPILTPQGARVALTLQTEITQEALTPSKKVRFERLDSINPRQALDFSKMAVSKKENPFELSKERMQILTSFLTGDKQLPETPVFTDKTDEENIHAYIKRLRMEMNHDKTPAMMCIRAFMPSILFQYPMSQLPLLLVDLSQEHYTIIEKIAKTGRLWSVSGFMSLYPYPFSDPCAILSQLNHIEAHRRILNIEGAVARMADYIQKVTGCACQGSSTFSRNDLAKAECVIMGGSGLFGEGAAFWQPPPKIIADRLKTGTSDISDMIKELKASRHMERHFTIATELDWAVYILAMMINYEEPLKRMDNVKSAKEFYSVYKKETMMRISLYNEELKPLMYYGGILTEYCKSLYKICKSIQFAARIPFPEDCEFCLLDDCGHMLGVDGRKLPIGYWSVTGPLVKSDKKILIPFPHCVLKPLPQEHIKEMAARFYAAEDAMIQSMLSYASVGGDPKCIQLMRAGRREVLTRMKGDSHKRDLTSVLWPSASLPGAVYSPSDIFGI